MFWCVKLFPICFPHACATREGKGGRLWWRHRSSLWARLKAGQGCEQRSVADHRQVGLSTSTQQSSFALVLHVSLPAHQQNPCAFLSVFSVLCAGINRGLHFLSHIILQPSFFCSHLFICSFPHFTRTLGSGLFPQFSFFKKLFFPILSFHCFGAKATRSLKILVG